MQRQNAAISICYCSIFDERRMENQILVMNAKIFTSCLLVSLLLQAYQSKAQRFDNNKSAKIISFRVEAENPGIDDRELILPLSQHLQRIFHFNEVELLPGTAVRWRSENPFNRFKKLKKSETVQLSQNPNDVYLRVEIEHRYNQVLGGLLGKARRHVMRLRMVMFTSAGHRVWYHKTKDSCCVDLGVDEEDENLYRNMDTSSFLELYQQVLQKTFEKL